MNLNQSRLPLAAACPEIPLDAAAIARNQQVRSSRPSGITDVLAIGGTPELGRYLSAIFQRFGWTLARTPGCAAAAGFLRDNRAAVAVCEESLPDGSWRHVALRFGCLPNAPALVVIGGEGLWHEVVDRGGFDVLRQPLNEADVVWTVASAWHEWMKRFEGTSGGVTPCSDA